MSKAKYECAQWLLLVFFFVASIVYLAGGVSCDAFLPSASGAYEESVSPCRNRYDHDGDGDIDLRDYAAFEQCFSGAGVPY